MDKYELAAQLRTLMQRQHQLLSMLRDYLDKKDLIQASAYALPPDDPDIDTRQDTQFIGVAPSHGAEALHAAQHAWGHLFAGAEENTRLVYRLPGAVQINSRHNEELAGIITAINSDRQTFRNLVTNSESIIGSHSARYEFLRGPNMFPMLITLQLYRQITTANETLRSISFCWAHKTVMQRVTKQQIIGMLRASQESPPRHVIDQASWVDKLNDELRLLTPLHEDARLVIRRPQPVHPQAWLVEGNSRRMQVASTPVLILGGQKVKIGNLKDYDITQKRAPRQTKSTANEPLISRIWLYEENKQ
ncbi:DNA replication terminus site-binding protein [Aeromonas sp. Y311-2]|jgi:DNA replication terminus site-binding protein|uniref:DNA replication terminus site-binding protein n=1 Tax=Aeromonas sp. Y311-2 TaxID=2990507 RepID=UPI0022E23F91|nr:DNA replication terminus site-binding protein [Aeromonas sp. Y311-2]